MKRKNLLYFFIFIIVFVGCILFINYANLKYNEDCPLSEKFGSRNIRIEEDKRLKELVTFCLEVIFNDKEHNLDLSRLNNINIYKSTQQESYTLNKKSIYICLNPNISDNTLFHVICHEFAHVINTTWGHNDNFWNCFETIIQIFKRKNIDIDIKVESGYCKEI